MDGLVEIFKNYCLLLPTQSDEETQKRLHGVIGRDGFDLKLVRWLEDSRSIFPEAVRISQTDFINDRGMDVYVEGQSSHTAVGFQIKSDNDLKHKEFLQKLKAQITDARAYANLKLYVIILACSPQYYGKAKYALNEELSQWQTGTPEVLLLSPGEAASLHKRLENPLTVLELGALLRDRTWERFFTDSGASERKNEFLNHWSGLEPQDRFAPPGNWERIHSSIKEHPLTVLVGPPWVGKTFGAVQLLYRHFCAGHPMQWFSPSASGSADFIVPFQSSDGSSFRVTSQARRMGMRSPEMPRNRWEFIAARLQSDALVLIEDPFGRTDDEFDKSLHSYNFFDLDGCIRGILEGNDEKSHLLMTTRHGMLDQWMVERRLNIPAGRSATPPGMNIIHLGLDNYRSRTFKNNGPLFELAAKLLLGSGRGTQETAPKLAEIINEKIQTPQEVEFLIAGLPATLNETTLRGAIQKLPNGVIDQLALACKASSDAERLFLFLLSLTDEGHGQQDWASTYAHFHVAMGLVGEASQEDTAARAKYWRLYYPRDYNHTNTLFIKGQTLLPWGIHLAASHPSVVETVRHEITCNGQGFQNRLADALPCFGDEPLSRACRQVAVRFLTEQLEKLDEAALAHLAQALPTVLVPSHVSDLHSPLRQLMNGWQKLPEVLKAAVFQIARERDGCFVANICDAFRYWPLTDGDCWKFYEILAQKMPNLGVDRVTQPWEYFVTHLEEAPSTMKMLFDAMASECPSRFALVLGRFAGEFWQRFPPEWKAAITSDHSGNTIWKNRAMAFQTICSGLFRHREECSDPLLELMARYFDHSDAEFRIASGTHALIHWEKLPERFHTSLRNRFEVELETHVLMEILQGGMSSKKKEHALKLAEIILDRCDALGAAWLMEILSEKNRENNELIKIMQNRCRDKAGEMAGIFDDETLDTKDPLLLSPMLRLAWLWKQSTGHKAYLSVLGTMTVSYRGEMPPDELRRRQEKIDNPPTYQGPLLCEIARGLDGEPAVCAHFILARQAGDFSNSVWNYLQGVVEGKEIFLGSSGEDISAQVQKAIIRGVDETAEEFRQRKKWIPAFPMADFTPRLTL